MFLRNSGCSMEQVFKIDCSCPGVTFNCWMSLSKMTLSSMVLLVTLAIIVPVFTQDHAVIGKREARLVLAELRKRHELDVAKRSVKREIQDEKAEIDLNLIARLLKEFREDERDFGKVETTPNPSVDGEKLIQEALKGNVDPNSEVVDLLESMFVDEGSRHNQHPDGIEKIASKKGKVFGDTHDGHRWTKQQLDELKNEGGRKRNFDKTITLWKDKIIPYTIDSSLSSKQANVDVINKAVKQFSDYTCLRWVPRGSADDTASYKSYIEFFSGSGCWSYVGRVSGDKQQISLKDPGCMSVTTAIHEMTHAIGQYHEQSRDDRDNHVTMMWGNIQGGQENVNMKKFNTHDYNPYDYESVLQYSLTAFSNGVGPSMVFKDQRLNFLADAATGLMFYDIQDITDAYDCTAPCKGPNGAKPLKECQNGGFVLHTCNCHCPDGLTGTLCETVVTDPVCGQGILNLADGESRTITSPNFDQGGPYPTGKKCVWLVKVPTGKFVRMIINEMDLTTKNGACDHWLEIQYNLIGQTGPRRCGKLTSSEQYITSLYGTPHMMLLKFDSAFAASATAGKGFNLTVSTIGLGCQGAKCVHGTCSDTQNGGYICLCKMGFTGRNCDLYSDTGDVSCGFEDDNCIFRNSPSNSYDWTRHTGSTTSYNTGPDGAKTGSYYLYAESSYPVTTGSKLHFETPYLKSGTKCLSFWYHMFGSSMGSLNVLRNDTKVWTRSGDQGNTWHRAEVNLRTTGLNYKLTFEAVRGSNYTSDIAIDDVTLISSACAFHPFLIVVSHWFLSMLWNPENRSAVVSYLGETTWKHVGSSTQAPTTATPSTKSPATQAPTTKIPTTLAPTTRAPTTQAPTTKAPTTQAPTTKAPTTQAPTTQAPTTQAPTTQAPITKAPTTQAPTTKAPTTKAPTTQPLTTQTPTTHPGTSPTTGPSIFSCSFEPKANCFLSNVVGSDDFNWSNRKGKTPSSKTGPNGAAEGSYYAYIEVSFRSQGDTAILESQPIPISSGSVCLTFAYHMYGQDIGSLEVLYEDHTYFNEAGNKGNQWNRAKVTLMRTDYTMDHKIQFVATRGYGFRGDIAVDDVRVTDGQCVLDCSDQPCGQNAVCIPDPSLDYRCQCLPAFSGAYCDTVTGQVNCTFDAGERCFLHDSQMDDFDWTINSGRTPSSRTGPSISLEGSYAYVEATGRKHGDKAVLSSEGINLRTTKPACLSFVYNMNGARMGTLNVWAGRRFSEKKVWTKSGNQGDVWTPVQVDIPSSDDLVIMFEGIRGSGYKSDIAIDSVRLSDTPCTAPST